jgi:cytoskeletal protein CcmA (bactofilin family)
MGILRRNKGLGRFDTVIGSKTVLGGSLASEEGVCIEGVVEGTVECRGNVMLGSEGRVSASVIAQNAVIGGEVKGSIAVRDRLEILPPGRVIGDIECTRLVVSAGATIEGHCHMIKEMGERESSPETGERDRIKPVLENVKL